MCVIMGVAPSGSQLSFDPAELLPGRTLKSSVMGGRPFCFLPLPRTLSALKAPWRETGREDRRKQRTVYREMERWAAFSALGMQMQGKYHKVGRGQPRLK